MPRTKKPQTPRLSPAKRWKLKLLNAMWDGMDLEELRLYLCLGEDRRAVLAADVKELQDMGLVVQEDLGGKMRFRSTKRVGIEGLDV